MPSDQISEKEKRLNPGGYKSRCNWEGIIISSNLMTVDDVPSTLDFYDELALLCNSRFFEMHATYWVKKLAYVSQ